MQKYMDEIQVILDEMFQESRGILCEKVRGTDRLLEELTMDSFEIADFAVRVEDHFGINLFDGGIVRTIGEVVEKLSRFTIKNTGDRSSI